MKLRWDPQGRCWIDPDDDTPADQPQNLQPIVVVFTDPHTGEEFYAPALCHCGTHMPCREHL